jgi:ketosteroid isomerase-like protein
MTNENSQSTMKFLLTGALCSTLLGAAGCNHAAASQAPDTEVAAKGQSLERDVAGLRRAEQVWVDSLTRADAKLLATLIDDQFTFIGPDAQVEKRPAYLAGYEGMKQAGVEVEGIDLHELEFRVLSDVGIVTGRVTARVKMQGTPIVENVRFTRVYRRSPDGWRMVTGQGTRIPTDAPQG